MDIVIPRPANAVYHAVGIVLIVGPRKALYGKTLVVLANGIDKASFREESMLQELELAEISVEFARPETKAVAIYACSSEETQYLVYENRMVYWDGQVDVAGVTWTECLSKIACCAPDGANPC